MSMKQATASPEFTVLDSTLMRKAFCAFAGLALLSLAISLGGRWFGHSIALGGYSDDTTVRAVMIGNNVLAVPANTIRFASARRDGPAPRLDLYLRYPSMDGYSDAARDDFNGRGARKNVLFLAFEPQMMSRGMSGRFAPIYQSLIEQPGAPGPHGIILYAFKAASGYLNERLAVAYRPGREPPGRRRRRRRSASSAPTGSRPAGAAAAAASLRALPCSCPQRAPRAAPRQCPPCRRARRCP